jgi:hypothetical protein
VVLIGCLKVIGIKARRQIPAFDFESLCDPNPIINNLKCNKIEKQEEYLRYTLTDITLYAHVIVHFNTSL